MSMQSNKEEEKRPARGHSSTILAKIKVFGSKNEDLPPELRISEIAQLYLWYVSKNEFAEL